MTKQNKMNVYNPITINVNMLSNNQEAFVPAKFILNCFYFY